jgi:hypothetical protein
MQLEDIDEPSWTGETALPRRETTGHCARPASAAAARSVVLNGDSQTLQTVNPEVESD